MNIVVPSDKIQLFIKFQKITPLTMLTAFTDVESRYIKEVNLKEY